MATSRIKTSSILQGFPKSRSLLAGNAAAPFNPTSIAGCKLWLDASDTSTISLSGSEVTQWNDKSGNAYNFAQGTSTRRPSSGTRTQNSLNVVDFDGTNDSLVTTAAKSAFNFLHYLPSTMFRVIKQDTQTGIQFFGGTNPGSSGFIGYYQYANTTNDAYFVQNGSGSAVYSITNIANSTNARYLTVKSDPANATAADRIKVSTDGAAFTGSNAGTATPSSSNSFADFILGNDENGGTLPFNGFIAEILIYDTILSAGDITLVQTYLAGKWAI